MVYKLKPGRDGTCRRGTATISCEPLQAQGPWLDENSKNHGVVRLEEANANVHWWIINEEADTNSGHYTPGGHVGMLYQDELYETVYGNAGYARLQSFGVVFGCDRVVVYVEPDSDQEHRVSANTARTHLLINGGSVDWSLYAAAFRDQMPDELVQYQDEIGQRSDHTDHRKAIRERLKSVRELFRFGRYKPSKDGKYNVLPPGENTGGTSAERRTVDRSTSSGGGLLYQS